MEQRFRVDARRSCRCFKRNVGWFTDVWFTYSEKRLKEIERFRGYLDLYLSFYWVTFVTQLIEATITEEPILADSRLAICLYRLARHSRKRNCLCTAHARQGGWGGDRLADEGVVIFVTFALSITF